MKTIRLAILPVLVVAAAPAQTNTAGHFAGSTATISNTLSLAGGSAQGSGSLAHGFATAAGEYAIALGYGASAGHNRSFVWAGGTDLGIASSSSGQFVVYAPGGIHLLGGTIRGDGSALTGINASNLIGLGSAALKPINYFAPVSAGTKANSAYNLASSANVMANSAYATASSALQANGRVDWTGAQNAAGQSITNLQGAYAFGVSEEIVQVTGLRLAGLNLIDPGCGFPYAGLHTGDVTNGFFGGASITHDEWWNWSITWSCPCNEWIGYLDLWSWYGWFYASGYYISYSMVYDEWNWPVQMVVASGSPLDGTYYYNGWDGFSRDDGAVSLYDEGGGSWRISYSWLERLDMGYFGHEEAPVGYFGGGYGGWYFYSEPYYEELVWEEIRAVTNAIPLEVADGRHAWVGSHDAGGFDLAHVGQLQAQVVVGDGAGLFNVGLGAMNLDSVDLRYLRRAGDTVTGDLEVNGTLTSGGRPVATLTHLEPQGDLSMGSFTNRPSQP